MYDQIEGTIRGVVRDLSSAAGEGLQAVVLHGSAAAGEYRPGKSDLNVLVVLERVDIETLKRIQKLVPSWSRVRVASPLVVDAGFLPRSLDSYPLEILGMRAGYRVVHGRDPLESLSPDPRDVRLQCEREIKAKLLWMRRVYIESGGKGGELAAGLASAIPAIEAILRGILYIQGKRWQLKGAAFREASAAAVGPVGSLLEEIQEVRLGKSKPRGAELLGLHERAMDLLEKMSGWIESGSGGAPGASEREEGR